MRMNPIMIKISAALLAMMLMGACSNEQADPPAEQPPAVTDNGGPDDAVEPSEPAEPSEPSEDSASESGEGGEEPAGNGKVLSVDEEGGIGDTIDYYGTVITLNGVRESAGDDFVKPQEGHVFKVVSITVKNDGTEPVVISSALSFAMTDDKEVHYTASISSDVQTLDGTLAPGEELQGEIAYEVIQEAKGLQLSFGDPMKMDRAVWNLEYL